mmetsp:Transcript_37220/g.89094  ORF Transcript_37220/g.89094 Transcript_37220/m.89094 type:complete len:724 (+) Transcript_37220:152-2323(+)
MRNMRKTLVLYAVIRIGAITCPYHDVILQSSSRLGSTANYRQRRAADGRSVAAQPSASRALASSARVVTTEELDGKYSVLTDQVDSMKVHEVLEMASIYLKEEDPSYRLNDNHDPKKRVGTWHFNRLIFDLGERGSTICGYLAQDLLEFMVTKVVESRGATERTIVPKPNTLTINGVLKAWSKTLMDEPGGPARRCESVLAKLALWQADGVLFNVSADTVSYNTVINCWKESVATVPGAAKRATDILALMEDKSTDILPDVVSHTSCISCWAEEAKRDPAAAEVAQDLLTRMYERSKEDRKAPVPTTRTLNAVLLANANTIATGRGKKALELLQMMERMDIVPDTYTFNIVMKSLANCGDAGASKKAKQFLSRMEQSSSGLHPDLLSYNTALDAFAKEGKSKSAARLLEEMVNKSIQPDSHSYTTVLTAYANARSEEKVWALKEAQDLFETIEISFASGQSDFRANTQVFNAYMNVWSKSGDRKALTRVTQLLSFMEELGFEEGGDPTVRPNDRTYCIVLNTLASNSKNPRTVDTSLQILEKMRSYNELGFQTRPTVRAFSITLLILARARKLKNKARKAQDLLQRMTREGIRPNVICFNAVLNACAFTGNEDEKEEAFTIACFAFDQLRGDPDLAPSHISYGTFLKACRKLMPAGDVRDRLVKGLFRRCCSQGLVSHFVLKEMTAMNVDYQSLLEGVSGYGNLPPTWSSNVENEVTYKNTRV